MKSINEEFFRCFHNNFSTVLVVFEFVQYELHVLVLVFALQPSVRVYLAKVQPHVLFLDTLSRCDEILQTHCQMHSTV